MPILMSSSSARRVNAVVTPETGYADVNTENPYAPLRSVQDNERLITDGNHVRRKGPALTIALGAFLGGLAASPLLLQENPLGFLGVLPGSIVAGFYYRLRSSHWQIDPKVRIRRYGYAILACGPVPLITAVVTGMRSQGFAISILAFTIGASVAVAILISGDRRFESSA